MKRSPGPILLMVWLVICAILSRNAAAAMGRATARDTSEHRVRVIVQLAEPALAERFPGKPGARGPLPAAEGAAVREYAESLAAARRHVVAEAEREGIRLEVEREFGTLFSGLAIALAADDVARLRRLPGVDALYPDEEVQVLPEAGFQTEVTGSLSLVGAPEVWKMRDPVGRPVTGAGRRVAILDTGIDYKNPDLGGGFGPGYKVIGGYDFVNGDTDPDDDHGHGTHMAMVVAASGTITGVAPGASLVAYKVLSAAGSGTHSTIMAALERAADPDGDPATNDAVDAALMALGSLGTPDSPLSRAVDRAVERGIVVSAAGGLGGSRGADVQPAVARRAIWAVVSDPDDRWDSDSTAGPVPGFYFVVKPDLTAPGFFGAADSGLPWAGAGSTGTAAAHVAGGAALVKQIHPDWTAEMVRANLMNTAKDLGAGVYQQGAGRLSLAEAATAPVVVVPASVGLGLPDAGSTATAELRLRNVTRSSVTATVTISAVLWSGADLYPLPSPMPVDYARVEPAAFDLAPGAEATATLQVSVPARPEPGYYTGQVRLAGAGYSIGVPFAFSLLPQVLCPDFVDPPGVGAEDLELVVVRWLTSATDADPGGDPGKPGYAAGLEMTGDGRIDIVDVMRAARRWEEVCR